MNVLIESFTSPFFLAMGIIICDINPTKVDKKFCRSILAQKSVKERLHA